MTNHVPCQLTSLRRGCLAAQQTGRGFPLPCDGRKGGHQSVVPFACNAIAFFKNDAELSFCSSQSPAEQPDRGYRGRKAKQRVKPPGLIEVRPLINRKAGYVVVPR